MSYNLIDLFARDVIKMEKQLVAAFGMGCLRQGVIYEFDHKIGGSCNGSCDARYTDV